MRSAGLVLAAISLCTCVESADATRVLLDASRDNTLYQDITGSLSSGLGPALFAGNTGGRSLRRALLAFDLSPIPAGVTLDSVQLVLHVNRTQDFSAREHNLHLVLAAWGEGTSNAGGNPDQGGGGAGAPATAGDATWLHRIFPNQSWTAAGGDFRLLESASTLVAGNGSYAWKSAQMLADAQGWLDGEANNGWILLGEEGTDTTARRIDSRQSPIASDRPKLIVDYTSTAIESQTWTSIKSLYRD